jgi:ceramide glucosyltransferase
MDAVVSLIEALSLIGAAYLLLATIAVRRFAARPTPRASEQEAVTVLKPLHGEDAELYQNLRSFCVQRYATFQIIFGVRNPDDAAIPIVQRLIAEFPELDLGLVVNPLVAGSNFKVSNLENMMALAKHEILVIADSDMHVGPDYLAAVTASLAAPDIGLVTCLYRGRPIAGLWSQLGAMFVNHGFLPSALVAQWVQPGDACFGATMALRRDVYDAVGGFTSLHNQLADDYALGEAVRRLGKTIALSPHLVDTVISEPSFGALLRHELRWARTLRLVAPIGYAASIVTQPVALATLGVLLSGFAGADLAVFVAALCCRLIMIRMTDHALNCPASPLWLAPFRDLLSFAVFIASFLGNRVTWRDSSLRIAADGRLVTHGDGRA